jgi:hypothetical protein
MAHFWLIFLFSNSKGDGISYPTRMEIVDEDAEALLSGDVGRQDRREDDDEIELFMVNEAENLVELHWDLVDLNGLVVLCEEKQFFRFVWKNTSVLKVWSHRVFFKKGPFRSKYVQLKNVCF